MRISVCIPQYNRIRFLLKSLEILEKQQYPDIEVVISDDCSTDDTEARIRELIPVYKYPIVYHRNTNNLGYDNNFRQSIQLGTGQYAIVIGNDDTINPAYDLAQLADFLKINDYPEIGFANFLEESSDNKLVERANVTAVLGKGYEVAIKYYSCFSFVGGLIYKRDKFLEFDSAKHDGSIYTQMYLGSLMVSSGCRLFSIKEPVVIKDIVLDGIVRNAYTDTLAKNWKQYRIEDAGLPSVMNVLIDAFRDAGVLKQHLIYAIFKKIYSITYPYWIMQYRSHGSYAAAAGLVQGLKPSRNNNFSLLNTFNKTRIYGMYFFSTAAGLVFPRTVFQRVRHTLYNFINKR